MKGGKTPDKKPVKKWKTCSKTRRKAKRIS